MAFKIWTSIQEKCTKLSVAHGLSDASYWQHPTDPQRCAHQIQLIEKSLELFKS